VNSRFHAAVANSAGTCAQRGAPAGGVSCASRWGMREGDARPAAPAERGARLLPGSDCRELKAQEVAVAALETTGGFGQAHVLLACHGREMAGF
jgi:hypothetical protein